VDRAARDPHGALADFDRALALSPSLRSALQSKASVLAEQLGRNADALRVLDRLLELYPDSVPGLAGRAVLQARLGHRDGAHRDARAALRRDGGGLVRYQAACAFALTSARQPADAEEALDLLRQALRQGFGVELLARDPDLAPLRGLPAFERLLEVTAALRQRPDPRN
jgi:tetratricopeptide (TPR) repeat protein